MARQVVSEIEQCNAHLMMAQQAVSALDSVKWHLMKALQAVSALDSVMHIWWLLRQAVSTFDSVIHIWWWHGKLCLYLTLSLIFDDGKACCVCTWQCHPHLMMATTSYVCTWQCHPHLMTARQAVSALHSVIHIWGRNGKLWLHLSVSCTDVMIVTASCVYTWQCHPHLMTAWQAMSVLDTVHWSFDDGKA